MVTLWLCPLCCEGVFGLVRKKKEIYEILILQKQITNNLLNNMQLFRRSVCIGRGSLLTKFYRFYRGDKLKSQPFSRISDQNLRRALLKA